MIKPNQKLKPAALALVLCAIAACALLAYALRPTPWDAGVQDYAQRVSHVFDAVHLTADVNYASLKYPSRRALAVTLPVSNMSLLDFLRLSQCDLQRLVGERNSALGRVMPASQLAFYSVQFIRLAQSCLTQGLVPTDLIQPLQQAIEQKQQALPSVLWNALIASHEFAQLYSLSNHVNLAGQEHYPQMPSPLTQALEQLQQIAARLLQQAATSTGRAINFKQDMQTFEQTLSVVGASSYAGRLALYNNTLARQLAVTHKQLSAAWQVKPLCQLGSNGQVFIKRGRSDALLHVLHHYYVPQVQGLAVKLLKQSDTFTQKMQALVDTLGVEQSSYDTYWQAVWGAQGARAQLRTQIQSHTLFWQQTLKHCQLSPQRE